jgi:hypothetical protein
LKEDVEEDAQKMDPAGVKALGFESPRAFADHLYRVLKYGNTLW